MKKEEKNKMWGGRFVSGQDPIMQEINSSINFDSRLYQEDIDASIAHAKMLSAKNIITKTINCRKQVWSALLLCKGKS